MDQTNQQLNIESPEPKKNWFLRHKFLYSFTVILIFVVVIGAMYWWMTETQRYVGLSPISNDQYSNEIKPDNAIAQICSNEKKLSGKYVPGQVILSFNEGYTANEIRKYMNENKYIMDESRSTLLEPTETRIKWTDSFNKKNEITVEEVNAFLGKISKESYISNIYMDRPWYNYSLTRDTNKVDLIDRWGYFTLTFSDPSKEAAFFAKYPEATFYGYGSVAGQYLYVDQGVKEITILYKAKSSLDILKKIKTDANLADYPIENKPNKNYEQRQVIFLNQTEVNAARTNLETNFSLNLHSDSSEIKSLLSKYPEIDIDKTIPEERLDFVLMKVPKGEEECWARELQNQPEIEIAEVNYITRLDSLY